MPTKSFHYEQTGHKGVRRYRLASGDWRYYAQGYADGKVTYLGAHETIDEAIRVVESFNAAHPKRPWCHRRDKPLPPKAGESSPFTRR